MNDALIISTREREVWMYEQKRKLDRLAADLNSARVGLSLFCKEPLCPKPVFELVPDPSNPDSMILRCGCKDRHFEPRPGASFFRQH